MWLLSDFRVDHALATPTPGTYALGGNKLRLSLHAGLWPVGNRE